LEKLIANFKSNVKSIFGFKLIKPNKPLKNKKKLKNLRMKTTKTTTKPIKEEVKEGGEEGEGSVEVEALPSKFEHSRLYQCAAIPPQIPFTIGDEKSGHIRLLCYHQSSDKLPLQIVGN
jgi:hypothetical protein